MVLDNLTHRFVEPGENPNFDFERFEIFHYCICADIEQDDPLFYDKESGTIGWPNILGRSERSGDDFVLYTGHGSSETTLALTLSHELAHNIGLGHCSKKSCIMYESRQKEQKSFRQECREEMYIDMDNVLTLGD